MMDESALLPERRDRRAVGVDRAAPPARPPRGSAPDDRPAGRGGRHFYVLRTGCQWRYLPGDFPPRSTVWRYFDGWRRDGTLDAIHDLLRRQVRAAGKPYAPRTPAARD